MIAFRIAPVFRLDLAWPKMRLFRAMWERGVVGKGGYSAKVGVSLRPALFHKEKEWDGWRVAFCGFEVSFRKSFGGIFA